MQYLIGLIAGVLAAAVAFAMRARSRVSIPTTPVTPATPTLIVWSWGDNHDGQLGNGAPPTQGPAPAPVKGPGGVGQLTDMTAIAAAYSHALALKNDGTVWAWGSNGEGQLGDDSTQARSTPIQVRGPGGTGFLTGISAIAVGDEHSLAVDAQGGVWAWGGNYSGQLGDGTTTRRTVPVQVRGAGGTGTLSGIVAVAGGSGHTLALKSDQTVWGWGLNVSGQVGVGSIGSVHTPAQVKAPAGSSGFLTGIRAIGAGNSHSVAARSSSFPALLAWGLNDKSQLGDGTTTTHTLPNPVADDRDIIATTVCGGLRHSLALLTEQTVLGWGENGSAQLGDGTTTLRTTPVEVVAPTDQTLRPMVALSATRAQALALANDGTLWTWGTVNGGVGDNTVVSRRERPTQVVGYRGAGFLTGVTAIASGGTFSLAIAPAPVAAQPDVSFRYWYRVARQDPVTHDWSFQDFLGSWTGESVYDSTGNVQTARTGAHVGGAFYIVRIRNAGQADDSFKLTGGSGDSLWSVTYYDAPAGDTQIDPAALGQSFDYRDLPDITPAATGSGWTTPPLSSGGFRDILIVVKALSNNMPVGGYPDYRVMFGADSTTNPAMRDAITLSFYWYWLG